MAASATEARRSALVVSPFATVPRDAGHRRRTWQMTRLLADAGYAVTFLLFAFEDGWAWRHDEAAFAELRGQWSEAAIVYAGAQVGAPPANGASHRLDEWWDQALEVHLVNLAARRFFDVVVVHNVWLSKAFDFIHPASTKVLETHDLFWKREQAFAAIAAAPSFFITDRESELFGLARADIVVTIQEREARELLALTPRRVVNVPFYDRALEGEIEPARLRHPGKVSFGLLASLNPFNVHGLNTLLAALEKTVAETFAPVEVVVGGSVGAHARSTLPVKRLGAVASERGFYASVDYAIAPVFAGTGFKIKTADALALAQPLLVAAHAAEGVTIDPDLVCATPQAMAARMVEISLRRTDPRGAQTKVLRARDTLRRRTRASEVGLLRAIAQAATTLVIDLHDVDLERSPLKLQGWLGAARVLAARARIVLILPDAVSALVAPVLPPGVRAFDLTTFELHADEWPRHRRIDATDTPAARRCDWRDGRWAPGDSADLDDFPRLSSDLLWEPSTRRLRDAWAAGPAASRTAWSPGLVVLHAGPAARPASLGGGRAVTFLDARSDADMQGALMRVLCGAPGCEIVVTAAVAPHVRGLALEACAVAGVAFRGLVDAAGIAPPALPPTIGRELGHRARAGAHTFTARSDAPWPPPV